MDFPTDVYGAWVGASVHSVGHAVGAGFAVSAEAGEVASLIKLTRVAFIAPLTLCLALWYPRGGGEDRNGDRAGKVGGGALKVSVPWFIVGFLGVVGINSAGFLPVVATDALVALDTVLLATAMGAIGLETRLASVRQVGLKPLWAGSLATIFISLMALGLVFLVF